MVEEERPEGVSEADWRIQQRLGQTRDVRMVGAAKIGVQFLGGFL